jgi:hypothetical protein
MGYDTLWLDNSDDVSNINFDNALFLTEGQVDQRMPVVKSAKYILHNCNGERFRGMEDRCLWLQVYTHDALLPERACEKVAGGIYFQKNGKCLYQPWATDLLPHEFDFEKACVFDDRKRAVYWIGTIGGGYFGNQEQLQGFRAACGQNGISFVHRTGVSDEEGRDLIRQSIVAPAIQGQWQVEKGYIPCRVFKNISYGQIACTNSATVHELFEGRIPYNPDTHALFQIAYDRARSASKEEIIDLMKTVQSNHTYINRIQNLLKFL